MGFTLHQLRGSRTVQMGSQFEPHQITYNFILEEFDDAGQDQSYLYELNCPQDVLHKFGQVTTGLGVRFRVGYPLDQWNGDVWTSIEPYTEFGAWIVRSATARLQSSKEHTWEVAVTITNMGRLWDDSIYIGPVACAVNTASNFKNVDAWRLNVSPSLDKDGDTQDLDTFGPSLNNASIGDISNVDTLIETCPEPWNFCHTGQDIGGTNCAIGAEAQPIKVATRNTQITAEFIVRTQIPIFPDDGTTYITPYVNQHNAVPYLNIQLLESFVGARNAEQIGQYAKGYLLCTAVDVQPLHYEFKRVILTFQYDEWAHAMQRPFITPSGVVRGELSCDGVTIPAGEDEIINMTANAVGWLQPYMRFFSFGPTPEAIFNDDWWAEFYWKMGDNPANYSNASPGTC